MTNRLSTILFAFTITLISFTSHAGTWGTMNFNSGKWGATPDVYTISSVEPGDQPGDLVVQFMLGGFGAAPETEATSFFVSCVDERFAEVSPKPPHYNVTAEGTQSPIILTGLSDGIAYRCSVVAANPTGSSSPSMAISGSTAEWVYRSNIMKIILMKIAHDAMNSD